MEAMENDASRRQPFLSLYHDCGHSAPEKFVEEIFWQSVFREALLLARCIWTIYPGFFREDLELIHRALNQTSIEDMESEIHDFRFRYPARGLLRGRWRVRISGKRLLNLARNLLARAH